MKRRNLAHVLSLASTLVAGVALPVMAQTAVAPSVEQSPPGGAYKAVSNLVKLPDFVPGLGQLFVDPATLPAGPFLAYGHDGKLVSTVYMLPIKEMKPKMNFGNLSAVGGAVDHVSVTYNPGHPGVEMPHIHVILWHVSDESLVAK
jgi:hypothetical protein